MRSIPQTFGVETKKIDEAMEAGVPVGVKVVRLHNKPPEYPSYAHTSMADVVGRKVFDYREVTFFMLDGIQGVHAVMLTDLQGVSYVFTGKVVVPALTRDIVKARQTSGDSLVRTIEVTKRKSKKHDTWFYYDIAITP